jgi:hypothetical protein
MLLIPHMPCHHRISINIAGWGGMMPDNNADGEALVWCNIVCRVT